MCMASAFKRACMLFTLALDAPDEHCSATIALQVRDGAWWYVT